MFSPNTTMPPQNGQTANGTRNRRKRNESDSVKNQPRRKRSKLSEDTFVPPPELTSNGSNMGANGHVGRASSRQTSASLQTQDIPVREKSSMGKRGPKTDGSVILTQNANYSIRQLPALPEQLRTTSEPYRASALRSSHYAVALFRNQALIWDHTSLLPTPAARVIILPQPSKPSEPLPFGTLVTSGTSQELGLAVVTSTGKIAFWDNVDSAQSLSLLQRSRRGVEGNIGLFSGELVTDLVDVEHAGFVVVLNSGRLVQLTLWDSQGRPAVTAQVFSKNASSGGLFGGIRHMFAGVGTTRDVAAVRARPSSTKGQMEVFVAHTAGTLQQWELSWTAQQSFRGELDVRQIVLDFLRQKPWAPELSGDTKLKLLDLAVLNGNRPEGKEISIIGANEDLDVLLLVSYGSNSSTTYALVELCLSATNPTLRRFWDLHVYAPHESSPNDSEATLLLPKPGHTAVVVTNDAVILVSLQGLVDAESYVSGFQDVVYFRHDQSHFAGWACEEAYGRSHASSCIAFVQGTGVIRVIAQEPQADDDSKGRLLTAKSKLEQAVFYGSNPASAEVLDLYRKPNVKFPQKEGEFAAEKIGLEVLESTSAHMSTSASTESQLHAKGTYVMKLSQLLLRNYTPVALPTRWILLGYGEKVAAAKAVWKVHQEHLESGDPSRPRLFPEIVFMLKERYKTIGNPETGDVDPVRYFLQRDIYQISKILGWPYYAIMELINEGVKSNTAIQQYTSEACDISIEALEAAYKYRQENAASYGLQDLIGEDGSISDEGHASRPDIPWTATWSIVTALRQLSNLSVEFGNQAFAQNAPADIDPTVEKLIHDSPRLVKLVCQTNWEFCHYAVHDEKWRERAYEHQERMPEIQHEQLTQLASIGKHEDGLKLAEDLKDMRSLVDLIIAENNFLQGGVMDPTLTEEEVQNINSEIADLKQHVDRYFQKFGEQFARAFYSGQIEAGEISNIFDDAEVRLPHLTKYLRADSHRAKLCWINDVLGNRDFANASESLNTAATNLEQNVWSKKVELSLAKLASFTFSEPRTEIPDDVLASVGKMDSTLRLIDIQEKVYKHIAPSAQAALDRDAEIELVMERFGRDTTARTPALQQLLRTAFEDLFNHKALELELLIDLLTLMDGTPSESTSDNISSTRFFVALQALGISRLVDDDEGRYMDILRLILKRLYAADQWTKINQTENMSDNDVRAALQQTVLFATLEADQKAAEPGSAPSPFSIKPQDCLGVDSSPDDPHLRQRFPSEGLREPIAKDNTIYDEIVERQIHTAKLKEWCDLTRDLAKEMVQAEMKAKSEWEAFFKDQLSMKVNPR